jgi:predicted house-cleaning noncanonical NTP pyrophosphatase (MazG superfamily)
MIPKLVRDKVPSTIQRAGEYVSIRIADEADREGWLDLKLQEEVDEFKKNRDPMELIDIYEVLRALWAVYNSEADISIEEAAAIKRETLGGFDKFVLLVDTHQGATP